MKFSVFQVSHKGGRAKNEDRMGYCYNKSSAIFMLADGMGGHPQGEVAAEMALQTMAALYKKQAPPEVADIPSFFTTALLVTQKRILQYAAERELPDTPRTTLVAAMVQGGQAYWVHCGDSRFYLIRKGELRARTRDHSYLEQRKTSVLPLPPGVVPNRNVLYTCLGSAARPVFDMAGPVALMQGDRMLLCSDGLWSTQDDADIVHWLSEGPVDIAGPELVERSLCKAGSQSDNVTLIAVDWEMPDHFETTRDSVSTDGMEDSFFTSTVQASGMDDLAEDLDDEAIERSIAEIKEAIHRSAARKA